MLLDQTVKALKLMTSMMTRTSTRVPTTSKTPASDLLLEWVHALYFSLSDQFDSRIAKAGAWDYCEECDEGDHEREVP